MGSNSSTNSMVIVAIPDENDRVWKVSSEKTPHLTLLFLGDADQVANPESIVQFVEHAADRSLNRFYLPVDHRDELGADQADVLFFKKGRYDFKAIRDFRALLLKDDNIKTAYDATSQYEFPDHVGAAGQPWIPHLTLGYPDSPAKEIPDDQMSTIYSVEFNKVAVWMGNYEGPEFMLKDYWDEMEDSDIYPDASPLAMASLNAEQKAQGLEHFGVKGMRWGVRKDTEVSVGGKTKMVSAKKGEKLDKSWEQRIYSLPGAVDVHNAAAEHFNARIGAINDKHDVTFTDAHWADSSRNSWSPQQKAYMNEVEKVQLEGTRLAVEKVHGKSPTGKLHARLGGENGDRIIVDHTTSDSTVGSPGSGTSAFKHADKSEKSEVLTVLALTRNAKGLIIKADPLKFNQEEEGSMAQADQVAEFLDHHGVKGMRWGVRNDTSGTAGGAKDVAKKAAKGVGKGVKGAVNLAGDISFENQALDGRAREAIISDAHPKFKKIDLPAIKAKPEHQQAAKLKNRLLHPLDAGTRAYRKDVRETYVKRLEESANSMTNFSGNRQFTIRERGVELPSQGGNLPTSKTFWDVSTRPIEHSDIETELSHAQTEKFGTMEVIFDEDGWITDIRPVKDEEALAQTLDLGAAFLAHHGVKGMRWGVRNDTTVGGSGNSKNLQRGEGKAAVKSIAKDTKSSTANAATKTARTVAKTAKKVGKGLSTFGKDLAFESTARKQEMTNQVHENANKKFAAEDLPRINAKYKDTKGGTLKGRLKNPLHPDTRAYRAESRIAYRDRVNEAVKALPTNASKTRKYEIEDYGKTNAQYAWTLKAVDVKKTVAHADLQDVAPLDTFNVRPVFDDDGFITDVKLVEDSLAQSVDFSSVTLSSILDEEELEHFGVKGMRWGVRNPGAVTTQTHIDQGVIRRRTKVEAKGGHAHDAHPDAVKAAVAKQVLKKSGTAALSNQDLRELTTRLQLEAQVSQLTTKKGQRAVQRQLEEEGKQQLSKGLRKGGPIVVKKVKKGAATAAVTALI